MSNILLKILIVVALILAGLVYYSNKIIHEKPIHEEESVVVKSVVMSHPPLRDKSRNVEKEDKALNESNESGKYVEADESNTTTVELTPNIPKDEVEVIADDSSLDEPEIVINDETEIIDDSQEEELAPTEEPPFNGGNELEVIEDTYQEEQIVVEEPSNDLGKRIGEEEEKKQNIDLGVQLF